MKKASRKQSDELRPEYRRSDFGTLVKGKYAQRASEPTNIVLLEPDVAERFTSSDAVNKALRTYLKDPKRKPAAGSVAPVRKRAAR